MISMTGKLLKVYLEIIKTPSKSYNSKGICPIFMTFRDRVGYHINYKQKSCVVALDCFTHPVEIFK